MGVGMKVEGAEDEEGGAGEGAEGAVVAVRPGSSGL